MGKGKFIVIDGVEGAGKSTIIKKVEAMLKHEGNNVTMSREPGGTPIAEQIRSIALLPDSSEEMSYETETLLMFAARCQHIQSKIKPDLENGKTVLMDRFTPATIAYQGFGKGVDLEKIKNLERDFSSSVKPDLTIIIDIDHETRKERISDREVLDHFEKEADEFFQKAREGYQYYKETAEEPVLLIDGKQPLENTIREIRQSIYDLGINNKHKNPGLG